MSLIGLVTAPARTAATLAGSAALLAGSAASQAAGRALGTGLANLFALMDPFPVALVGFLLATRVWNAKPKGGGH